MSHPPDRLTPPRPLPGPAHDATVRRVASACAGLLIGLGGGAAVAQTASSPPAAPVGGSGATAPAASGGSPAASSAAVRALIDQARHWQQRQRADLAAQAWQKLLGIDPRHPDALQGMASLSLDAGKFEEAASYVNRLRQARPDHPALARLGQQVRTQTSNQSLLSTARQYAQAGQTEAAARAYRQALGNQPPADELAMEYYQTLGGTREGWDEARRGLERLTQAAPGQVAPALAYARHLSYRESTRRDAIARLTALATRTDVSPGVQQEARNAWRQALIWLDARQPDTALYRQFLGTVGDDPRVRARLDEVGASGATAAAARAADRRAGSPATPAQAAWTRAEQQAFDALNAGDLDVATERFEALLRQRGDDGDALAGLGIVRMKQERFDESADLLERAAASARGARWKPMLRTVRHWQAVHEAHAARLAGDLDRATQRARGAVESQPNEPEAQVLLGDLMVAQAQLAPAEAAYRAALRQEPRHARATAGLAAVLGALGKPEAQQTLIRQTDPDLLARLGGAAGLKAGQLRLQADLAQQRGDLAGAQALLEQAVAQAPGSPWVRLSLGQLLVRQGRADEARAQVDAFVVPATDRGDALQARALLQAELKDWSGALRTLEEVPARERHLELSRLQRRLAVQAQAAQAVALGRAGQAAAAQALLAEAEAAAGQDTDLIGAIAGARMDLGDELRAGQLIRATLAAQPQAGAGLKLRHAALLLRTRQDAELAGVLRQLAAMNLSPAQRRDLDDLRMGHALRQADLLREQGQLALAWEAIAPLLQERPQEPRLLMSLARLHAAADDPAQARALYEAVLRMRPDDLDAWLGLAGSADAQKDHETARQALDEARRLAPESAQVLAQFARHHRAQGQHGKAADYLRAAIAAERPATPSWGLAAASANPFAGRDGGRAMVVAGVPLRAPAVPVAPAAFDPDRLDRLPPTAAGLPAGGETPVARSMRWRQPERPAAAAAAPQPAALPGRVPMLAAAAPPARRARTLDDELAEVQAERGRTSLALAGTVGSRSGEAGLGRLDTMQAPIEGRRVIEDVGQVVVRATPVVIDAGQASASARSRIGTLGLDTTETLRPGDASDAGMGLSVGLETGRFAVDIGTTPVGFAVTDVVGGVRYDDAVSPGLRLTVDASRRAVTDSVLSWAGMVDPRTGRVWGGVRATGVRGQLAWEHGDSGVYGYGGAHAIQGRQVQDNSRVELGVGGYWQMTRQPDERLEVGLNLGYQHHAHNLRGYTWGHGGYFSPQHLVALTLPVQWVGRSGRLTWGLQGSAGMQAYREEAAPYYPTDPAAQGALDALAAQQRVPASVYAARSDTGMTFNLGGAIEYQLTRQLDIGTRLGFERAPQFTASSGSVYLRFSLEPRAFGGQGLRMPAGPATP